MTDRRVMASTHCPHCRATFHLVLKSPWVLAAFTVTAIELELTTCP